MIGATNVQPGPRMAGAFMRNVQVRLTSPAPGATNTSATVTLQAVVLDPLRRSGGVIFQLDRSGLFGSFALQTSPTVTGIGWADVPLSWASTAIGNGTLYYRAQSSQVKVGGGPSLPAGRYATAISFIQAGGAGIPRSLYLYVNKGPASQIAGIGDNARSLYLYVNRHPRNLLDPIPSRSLYLYVNRYPIPTVQRRSLYVYSNPRDGEVFPYLNHLSPTEQYEGGQVDLYGDGFGQYLEARASATLTVSSTSGGNIPENVRDGTAAEWLSTSGASSWIRFTWGASKRIVGVVLEGIVSGSNSWGIPRFRFDDASSQDGAVPVAQTSSLQRSTEYPVGAQRQLYWLATPKVTTYLEIAVASGGVGTNRGFGEVWIIEEIVPAQNAETARAVLNLGLPAELTMGIAAWVNRSPNWYPANSGLAPLPAATVTVPTGATSGLVYVEEQT